MSKRAIILVNGKQVECAEWIIRALKQIAGVKGQNPFAALCAATGLSEAEIRAKLGLPVENKRIKLTVEFDS